MATQGSTTPKRPARAAKAATPPVVEGEIVPRGNIPADDTPDVDGNPTAVIEFEGRRMLVRRPSIEQIAMYRRIAKQMEALKDREITTAKEGESVVIIFDRAAKMIESVLVDADDREWVQDQLLAGRKISDLVPILRQAIDKIGEQAAARKTTGPAARGRARRTR